MILLLFILKDKREGFYAISIESFKILLVNTLKIIYHEIRPSFQNREIALLSCSC